MIIGNLDIGGVAAIPTENDAPLLVNADTPESVEISGERFETVGRRSAELIDGDDFMKLAKFHKCPRLNISRDFPRVLASKDL